MVLKRVGVWSVAKFSAIYGALLGLIFGLFVTMVWIIGGSGMSAIVGLAAPVVAPIVYAVGGLIGGAIGAALFNLVAGISGGIEMEYHQQ